MNKHPTMMPVYSDVGKNLNFSKRPTALNIKNLFEISSTSAHPNNKPYSSPTIIDPISTTKYIKLDITKHYPGLQYVFMYYKKSRVGTMHVKFTVIPIRQHGTIFNLYGIL